MTLGPTRQLLTTGERLLQLAQQLQQPPHLEGLTNAYTSLIIDPLTRLENQLQGIPIEDNGVRETLTVSTDPWGSGFPQSTSLPVNSRLNLPLVIKPSSNTDVSISSKLEQAPFSEKQYPESIPSTIPRRPNSINAHVITDQDSSLPTSTKRATSEICRVSTLDSQVLHKDELSSSLSTSSDSSVNLQSAPLSAPTPHVSSSTISTRSDSSLTQTESAQATALPASLPVNKAASQLSSPLRMVQSPNKLASILKTQLTPSPTTISSKASPPEPTFPSFTKPFAPNTHTPTQFQTTPLSETENLDKHSTTQTTNQQLTHSSLSPLPPFPPSSSHDLDPLDLDLLVDAVADRLEFDRLRLYGTSSL